jgi:CMP-N-acetylneuraminic acid synthetase
MENFKENVKQLKYLNESLEKNSKELAEAKKSFEDENSLLIQTIKDISDHISKTKEVISENAIEQFKESGDKKLFGGVGVQERTKLSYDESEVLKIAKEKDMFVTLDKKSFEKVARNLTDWGVTITKEPKVTFPKVIKIEG